MTQRQPTCPVCGNDNIKVRELKIQATRVDPHWTKGMWGYCPKCDVNFQTKETTS